MIIFKMYESPSHPIYHCQ